jgi:hypothetical protein
VLQAALSSFDTNHDGVISSGEYWNFGDPEAFSATDANADGRIDATEWQAWISDTQPRPQDHPFWNAKTYLLSRPSTLSAPVPVPPTLPPVPPPSVALVPPSPPPQKSLLWKGLLGSVFVALLGLVGIWGRERRRRRRRSRS